MGFQTFTESEINSAIYRKAPLTDIKGKSHKSAKLTVDGVTKSKIKIPNPHSNEFRPNKAKFLASSMCLDSDQYNDFMKCDMKPKEYEDILRNLNQ